MQEQQEQGPSKRQKLEEEQDLNSDEEKELQLLDEVADTITIEVADLAFRAYLERTGVIEAIKGSVASLYLVEPRPTLPMQVIRNEFAYYCDMPPDPLMEFITAIERVQELQKEIADLREKMETPFQGSTTKKN